MTSRSESKRSRSRTTEDEVRRHKKDRDRDREFERVKVKEEPLDNYERIRVKEEPVSDFEDNRSRRGRSHNNDGPPLDADGDLDMDRIRSRRPDRDRDPPSRSSSNRVLVDKDGDLDVDRRRPRIKVEDEDTPPRRRIRSRSRSPDRVDRDRDRDRDRSNRNNPDDRNRGRGGRNDDNRGGHDRNRDRDRDLDSNGRRRDPVREREWKNFFHPDTATSSSSSSAVVKVKKELTEHEKYGLRPGNKDEEDKPEVEKEKPNFALSGKLTAETNTFRGVVIKYSEPPEARKPNKFRWRLYPFKEDEVLPVMYIHRQSAYLLGRDRKIADIPIDHPSCSKQHAAIQYRLMPYERANGTKGRRIKPYIIDLESANGTFVNGDKIESKRYVELFEKDALKFGFSSREYILLHENSKDDPLDDEVGVGGVSPLPAVRKEEKPNLGNMS